MLYFLHGDVPKAAEKANQMVNAMLAKQPDASRFRLDTDNFSVDALRELLGSQGLFSSRYIIDLRRLFDEVEIKDSVMDFVAEIQESPNIFIWVEADVDKKSLTKIEKHTEKMQEFAVAVKKDAKSSFNIFALSDALGARDKKKLWLQYMDAVAQSVPEEIHGTLFWQVKSMLLAVKGKSAEETGLKPFVFNKSKTFAKNYSLEELEKMSHELVTLSHDARRGKHNFGIALERWVLGV